MKFRCLISLVSLVLILFVSVSNASILNDIPISEWAGTGNDVAYCMVDFDPSVLGDEYFFGYRFDASQNVKASNMLAALSASTSLVVGINYGFVDRFAYNGKDVTGVWEENGLQSYWAYVISPDGVNWTYSQVGVAGRTLANGTWDSFTYTVFSVPEPFSIAILALGGLFLRRKN